MNKSTIKIKGMHCHSCEILIEDNLKKIPEIKNAHVDWKKKEAVVYSKHPINPDAVRGAVEEAGYEIGVDDQKNIFSANPSDYTDTLVAVLVLALIYLIAKGLGFSGFSVGANASSSLGIVFIVGLTAGVSSCMALVGGLILGISAKFAEKHPEATSVEKFRPHTFFILGRILSYFLLGGVIGMIGKVFSLSGVVLGIMTIIVGLVMLLVGLQLTELFPVLSNLNISLPAGLGKKLGLANKNDKEYSHTNSSVLGVLTFFLPCGFTQAMMLLAMNTGSFLRGAMIMGIFALGTAPGLLGIGGLTSVVTGKTAKKFFKFAGVLVIALAIFNLSNGLSLTGATNFLSSLGSGNDNGSSVQTTSTESGFQVVRMTQDADGYSPNVFRIKKGVPVRWIISSTDQTSCASSLISQKINVRRLLQPGENTIEFTPAATGTIPFSCSMGMYRGQFIVE